MDYIDFKEFKKQPEKIQKVLKDWWQPKYFDLIHYECGTTFCGSNSYDDIVDIFDWKGKERNWIEKDKVIPLFTETQLRKFIEEKTGRKVQSTVRPNNKYIIDLIGKRYRDEDINIRTKEDDLLKAYWQVACNIAQDI